LDWASLQDDLIRNHSTPPVEANVGRGCSVKIPSGRRDFNVRYTSCQFPVAEKLAKIGDSRSANRVTAAVCVVGHWTIAAKAVLLLDPTAFTLLARILAKD
jgi:hypothetical protein